MIHIFFITFKHHNMIIIIKMKLETSFLRPLIAMKPRGICFWRALYRTLLPVNTRYHAISMSTGSKITAMTKEVFANASTLFNPGYHSNFDFHAKRQIII